MQREFIAKTIEGSYTEIKAIVNVEVCPLLHS